MSFFFFVLTNSQKQNTNKLVEEEQKGEADTHTLSQTKKMNQGLTAVIQREKKRHAKMDVCLLRMEKKDSSWSMSHSDD